MKVIGSLSTTNKKVYLASLHKGHWISIMLWAYPLPWIEACGRGDYNYRQLSLGSSVKTGALELTGPLYISDR